MAEWKAQYKQVLLLAYQSFGVVYGDLSTSPLYVYKSTFSGRLRKHLSEDAIFGVLSLIFWTFTLLPLFKYVVIVLSADDNGEGGTFALYSLLCRHSKFSLLPNQQAADEELSTYYNEGHINRNIYASSLKRFLERHKKLRTALLVIVLFGACMVIGDGVLTPAISVLSSVSGLQVRAKNLHDGIVVVIACAVLVGLFALQHRGTQRVAFLFAPIVTLWLLSIAVIGIYNIIEWNPKVYHALSPYYIYKFFRKTGKDGWYSLGGVLLCITGTEAMFADLGHFTDSSIRVAFSGFIYPCLVLQYMGQAAFLSKNFSSVSTSFYASIPSKRSEILKESSILTNHHGQSRKVITIGLCTLRGVGTAFWMVLPRSSSRPKYAAIDLSNHPIYQILFDRQENYSLPRIIQSEPVFWPVFVLATLAAVVASQAVISATFSIVKQCQALGCFPRVKVVHTSRWIYGQIYIPEINWILMVLTLAITIGFQDTTLIGNAYGIASMTVMFVTTCLMALVIIFVWQKNILLALAFLLFFGFIEGVYLAFAYMKVPQGGWVPLVLSTIFLSVMYVWHYGTKRKYLFDLQNKVSMKWILTLGPSLGIVRVPGIGLIYTELVTGVPAIFSHFVTNLPAFHQVLVFVCVKSVPVPNVNAAERYLIGRIGPKAYRMYRCIVRYGYKDVWKDDEDFEINLIMSIAEFIQLEAEGSGSVEGSVDGRMAVVRTSERFGTRLVMMESSDIGENSEDATTATSSKSTSLKNLQSLFEQESPQLRRRAQFNLPNTQYVDPEVKEELLELVEARNAGIAYIMGHSYVKARRNSSFLKKFVIDVAYSFLRKNCRGPAVALNIPHISLIEVGMIYNV